MLEPPRPDNAVRDVLEYYVKTVSPQKRSYESEVYRIRALQDAMGHLRFDEVAPIHVVSFRDRRLATPLRNDPARMLAGSTVKAELMLLSHVYTMAISEWGMGHLVNPVARIRKPRSPPGRTRRLAAAEEHKILKAAARHPNRELYAIIQLALHTAMRQGELLSLLWENIHWTHRTVHLPRTKNGDPRDVPLSRTAYEIFDTYLERKPKGRVFTYSSAGFKSTWRFFINTLGVSDLHFHDLRHCAISSLLERGLNTIEVAAISGHKSMSMLKRYSHLQAWKLVEKLDPKPRAKRDRPLLREQLPPYPAILTKHAGHFYLDFPDFINLCASGVCETAVIEDAQAKLLRTLVVVLCDGGAPPIPTPPDVLSVSSAQSRVVMISPI